MFRLTEHPSKEGPPAFAPGDLVSHKRYGYRGVVVAVDSACWASEDWYQSNQTQPDRNQPWYHVLVHDSSTATYPAESSLSRDSSGDPINHPWVGLFFLSFVDGRYLRNDNAWPNQT